MAESFEFADQQRRQLYGEAPDSLESAQMRALLGGKAQQQGLVPYEGIHFTHEHIDNLQAGQQLGHFVLDDMLQSRVSISMLFPFQEVMARDSYFEWTIERFRAGIAPIVPEEAPFPEMTFAVEPRYTKLQRRGAAVRMTANILNTDEGRARLQSQLLKVAVTVLLTIEHLMLQTLVTAHDGPMFRRKMTLDKYPDTSPMDQASYDASRFACYHRSPNVEVPNDMAEVARALGEVANGPYAVLYPVGKQAMLGGRVLLEPSGMKVKAIGGDQQILQFDSPSSTMRLGDGSLAFAVPEYMLGNDHRRFQPLLRSTFIGEHYSMTGVQADDLAWRTGSQLPGGGFSTDQRAILPYDVKDDQNNLVRFNEAFDHSYFVRRGTIDADPMADELNRYGPLDFTGVRKAPLRLYYENGPAIVTHFGQFDDNAVPAHIHRRVGNTIAAVVTHAEGDALSGALSAGKQLLRELDAAPINANLLTLLDVTLTALQGAGVSTYAVAAPDLAATYGIGNISVIAQTPDGIPSTVVTIPVGAPAVNVAMATHWEAEIGQNGTPPFLASLSGLRLLAALSATAGPPGSRLRDLGTRAAALLNAAERIYSVLHDKFPDAVAFDPRLRPLNHLPADGFATWFAASFLNSGHLPLLYTVGATTYVTPFVVPPRDVGRLGANMSVGTVRNPVERAAAAAGPILVGARATKAHARTPWVAQHGPFAAAVAQAALRPQAGRRRRRGAQPEDLGGGGGGVDADVDLYGTQPAYPAASAPIGGMLPSDDVGYRRLHDIAGPAEFLSPMNTDNARRSWDAADAIEEPLVRICTLTYLTAPCDLQQHYDDMMASNILVPFDILLVRPALELDMYSLLALKPGFDTGFHAIADTVVDFGKDVDHQTRKITFSVRHAFILKGPDSVAILPSRIARRYVSGGGVQLFTEPAEMQLDGTRRPDLIAFVLPMDHQVSRIEPIGGLDIKGLYGRTDVRRWPDAERYERIWNLSSDALSSSGQGSYYYEASGELPNVTWRGQYYNYNRTILYEAQGHRRGGSHSGCRAVWDGNEAVFPIDTTNVQRA